MSHRKHATHERRYERRFEDEPPQRYSWLVYAVGMLLVGGLSGYILSITAGSRGGPVAAAAAPASVPAAVPSGAASGMVDEVALKTYREILSRDPKNLQAAVSAGNLLYDAKRFDEAIPFYQQALRTNASDVNVSTDLGTALWYTGRADAALAQYAVSLAIDPTHAQTLFNLGIVRSDGKNDYAGAVQAWEALLSSNPTYPNASNVRTMIAQARAKGTTSN
ncbi:MAG TPA: tetratricopeptide repeat protein [Vicinamibacterales bacterium]|nr:tetratricopeptide repeat protein [Vicinamibacterales bacterium]